MRLQNLLIAIVVPLLTAACATEGIAVLHGPAQGGGSVTFALDDDAYSPGGTSFRVRLFQGVPSSLTQDAYFASDCIGPSLGFRLDDLEERDDYVLVYQAYSGADCAADTLVAVGIRGGIEVSADVGADALYFVQVNALDAITGFPVPGPELNPATAAGGVPCNADEDCRKTEPCATPGDPTACRFQTTVDCAEGESCTDGVKVLRYVFHPQGVCDPTLKVCRLPSLFPLNADLPRAFHGALSGDNGNVALLGGFNRASSTALTVDEETSAIEVFGAGTSLFKKPDPAVDLQNGLGMSTTISLDGRRALVIGGAQRIPLAAQGGALLPSLEGSLALSPHFFVVDAAGGTAVQSDPGFLTAGALAALVDASGLPRVFVRPGVFQLDASSPIVAGTVSYGCNLDGESVLCGPVPGSDKAPPRLGATGACLASANGRCQRYLVVGGGPAGAAMGELYDAASDLVRPLLNGAGVPASVTGAVAVSAGGKVWTLGGRTAEGGVIDAYSWDVNGAGDTLTATPAGLSAADQAALARTYHQATVLADGTSILVTGGVEWTGGQAVPSTGALVLEVTDGKLSVKARLNGLSTARVGHAATLVRSGLYAGAVLISGGLSGLGPVPAFAPGVDLYLPAGAFR